MLLIIQLYEFIIPGRDLSTNRRSSLCRRSMISANYQSVRTEKKHVRLSLIGSGLLQNYVNKTAHSASKSVHGALCSMDLQPVIARFRFVAYVSIGIISILSVIRMYVWISD